MNFAGKLHFNKVAIIGVGLLGASFALALKEKELCGTIIGCGRSEENLKRAKERGIIDNYRLDAAAAAENADLVLLSSPVGSFKKIVQSIRPALKNGSLVTDVGSVKGSLVAELESLMPAGVHFIGSHPIAGSEKSGIDDARSDLFNCARCIITPTANSDKEALKITTDLWSAVGGTVEHLDAFTHDEIYAAMSHLPHLIAYALVNTVGSINENYLDCSGGGFRDTTRIASSSPEMWKDIAILNRDNLLKDLAVFRQCLGRIETKLKENDPAGLTEEFGNAQKLRMKLDK